MTLQPTPHGRAVQPDWPDISTDLAIIANFRLWLISQFVEFDVPPTPNAISPFDASPRCYFFDADLRLLALFPFDVRDEFDDLLLAFLLHCKAPVEYWFLEDDQVVLHGETHDDDLVRARQRGGR